MQKKIIEQAVQNENSQESASHKPMSDELQQAIQNLISSLREGKPELA